jgi:hemoglobin-like flavoprotein
MKGPHATGHQPNDCEIELFNDSLERCAGGRRLLNRFYKLFVTTSPEVAAKFANTDFSVQERAVKVSFYLIMSAIEQKPEGDVHLERIAALHSRKGLDIRPDLYDQWLDCLIQAVREHDPAFSEEIEQAWRSVMRVGIEFMKSRY